MDADDHMPEWLRAQRGFRYQERGRDGERKDWIKRREIVRRYVEHLQQTDRAVTAAAVRQVLAYVDRGYSLSSAQISKSLAPYRRRGLAQPYQNGSAVVIAGQFYRSARVAAEALGVSPQTVLNRVASGRDEWRDWRKSD